MPSPPDLGQSFERVLIDRAREADQFYADLRTDDTTDEEAAVMKGARCKECGNYTVIRKDGCDFCSACGWTGACG